MKTVTSNEAFSDWALAQGLVLVQEWPDFRLSHWRWTPDMSVQDVQTMAATQAFASEVDYVEPNYTLKSPPATVLAASAGVPFGSGTTDQTPVSFGQVEVRTALVPGRSPVVVAVIDSGVDLQHEIFTGTGAAWTNPAEIAGDGLDNDGNGFVDDIHGWNFVANNNNPLDDNGHGTHCAGVVLGTGQNIFARPLAPAKVKIMALKFLPASGTGSTSAAIGAIFYAVKNGARVLSNSWGGGGPSRALEDAVAFAYENNVAFIAAAGNEMANNDAAPVFPASYGIPQVVSVAATDDSDQLASFSNFGPNSVVIAAPGVRILSSVPNNLYSRYSGTSMATPFVAGTAALMAYIRPQITAYEIKALILDQAKRISLQNKVMMNRRLDVVQAVRAAETKTLTGEKPGYSLSGEIQNKSSKSGGGGGCGSIITAGGSGPQGPTLLFLMTPLLFFAVLRWIKGPRPA